MRLIDADKINPKDVVMGNSAFAKDIKKAMQDLIDSQPTAYDIDKVIEQLENRSTLSRPIGWSKSYEIVTLDEAKEIVKAGGEDVNR